MTRWIAVAAVTALGCGDADPPRPTSGPLESIVHIGPTGVQLYARQHRLDLGALPIAAPLGLPLAGPIELDANVTIPLLELRPAPRYTSGRVAVRCVGRCRLGDDRTPAVGLDGPLADGGAFSHVDLDGLDAQLVIRRGVARLTRWTLPSPEVETAVGLEVRLASDPGASALAGCVRYRPTAALAARDPRLHALAIQAGAAVADGWYALRIDGTVDAPQLVAAPCEPATGG